MRHRRVVDEERPRPAGRGPDPAVELPDPDEHQDDDERRSERRRERDDPVPRGTPRVPQLPRSILTRLGSADAARPRPHRRRLQELRALTGDEDGAQRVAWTDTWETARDWLRGELADTGAREEIDEAGNQWFTLGESPDALLIGGHLDSVPNGGWLDGSLERRRPAPRCSAGSPTRARRRVSRSGSSTGPTRRARASAARCSARRRPPARCATRTSSASSRTATGSRSPTRSREHGVDLDRALDARAQLEGARRLPRAAHRAGPGARVAGPPARASCSAPSASSAHGSPGAARRRTPARRRWTSAATRSPARRSSRSRFAAIARETGGGAVLHLRRRRLPAGDRHLRRRDGRAAARPAPPRRGTARRDARRREGGLGALRRRGADRGRRGSGSGHRADPLRRHPDRLRRRGDPRGGGHLAPASRQARSTTPRRSRAPACRP